MYKTESLYYAIAKKTKQEVSSLKGNKTFELWCDRNKGKGDSWTFNYLIFQLEYWRGLKTGIKRIQPNWIFGQKAEERFRDRDASKSKFFLDKFVKEFNLKRLRPKEEVKNLNNAVFSYLEDVRMRNFNKVDGFIECKAKEAYNEDIELCKKCSNKEICKEILQLYKFYILLVNKLKN